MTCSRGGERRAVSIGPAASLSLSAGAGTLRVHSVFPSTLNLEAEGARRFVSLCGPGGGSFPHSVVLEQPEDFDTWPLEVGMPARLSRSGLRLSMGDGAAVVDLARAERPPPRTLPAIGRLGSAHRACTSRLAEIQRETTCDLRIEALWCARGVTTALGARLRDAALGAAGAARAGEARAPLRQAVAALMGLGAGLTPSGDDFLCGFMAASRCVQGGSGLVGALNGAAEDNAGRTGAVSAFLVRCAIEGFWPTPLGDLAEALAGGQEAGSLRALGELCGLGHTSGADLATGFLFGLEWLLPPRPVRRS